MNSRLKTRRYLPALSVAYLLVFQLLLIGVSVGTRFGAAVTADATSWCAGEGAGHKEGPEDAGWGLPPCCSIACPMVAAIGLPPPPPAGPSPARLAHAASLFARHDTHRSPQIDTASFHARGPPSAA